MEKLKQIFIFNRIIKQILILKQVIMKAKKTLTDPFEIAMFWINAAEKHGIKVCISNTMLGGAKKLEAESIKEKFNINPN